MGFIKNIKSEIKKELKEEKCKIRIKGMIIQVLEFGTIVHQTNSKAYEDGKETIFIYHDKKECEFFEGQKINVVTYFQGEYEYTTVNNIFKRIRAYTFDETEAFYHQCHETKREIQCKLEAYRAIWRIVPVHVQNQLLERIKGIDNTSAPIIISDNRKFKAEKETEETEEEKGSLCC